MLNAYAPQTDLANTWEFKLLSQKKEYEHGA